MAEANTPKARVTLYKIPRLLDENNFIVENSANFLAQFNSDKLGPISIQYQRLESSKRLKLDLSQNMAVLPQYNYCLIENGKYVAVPRPPHYSYTRLGLYFIVGWRQRANNTVELDLKLDVLNQFFPSFKDYFTPSTYIARTHRDRFMPSNVKQADATVDLCAIFNRVSENDSPKLVRRTSQSATIYDSRGGDSLADPLKFYLIYRNGEEGGDTRPCVDLAASRELPIAAATAGGDYVMSLADLNAGTVYYLVGDIAFSFSGDGYTSGSVTNSYAGNGILIFTKVLTNIPNKPQAFRISFVSDTDSFATNERGLFLDPIIEVQSGGNGLTVAVGPLTITKGTRLYYSQDFTTDEAAIRQMESVLINAGTTAPKYLGRISQLDRTLSTILKVVECPYCPISYSYDSVSGLYTFDTVMFPSESPEDPHFLRTYNVGAGFGDHKINEIDLSSYVTHTYGFSAFADLSSPFLKDPKLYTSPYFSITFVYDSFSMAVKMEDYDRLSTGSHSTAMKLGIIYKQSSNISSDLAFLIDPIKTYPTNYNYRLVLASEDYPQLIIASRNNELPLFSSSYLDYIRNGYNYDKKKAADAAGFSYSMAGLQIAASILSFAASSVTGGVSAAAGIGLASSGISSLAGAGYNAMKADEDIAQKINQLKAQSFKVANIDNLDLFNFYAGNKLQAHFYELEAHVEQEIAARFQLYGYAAGVYGNPIDLLYTRKFFNYIKCDPVFRDGQGATDLPPSFSPFIEEISEKLRAGVTLFHPDGYDLDRWKENIEVSILEAIE